MGLSEVTATDKFAETTPDVVGAILTEAGRLADEVMAPVQRAGDLHPAVLENGTVRSSPGFDAAYAQYAEGGWVGIAADPEHGGMGLPASLNAAVTDMMSGACLSLHLNPLLSQGQIEALEHHASDELKAIYLPKLISGAWNGTMNLTEPQAGSDVGALSTQAVPNGDGTYAVTGQKIFISWGESDINANTCHLVLARLPDGAPGTRGISLFMVPRFIPDAQGEPGVANTVKVVSLEHKMGLHGSPTAVMQFDGATGWLVGEPHKGMAAMFTMMNNARLGVGLQGIGAAEGAYQHALAYALERKQGKTVGPDGTISDHADVRRMLVTMKAELFAARAISSGLCHGASTWPRRSLAKPEWEARAGLPDAHRQGLRHRYGHFRCPIDRHPGPWRHGVCRRDGGRAVLPRRPCHGDLRRHERDPGRWTSWAASSPMAARRRSASSTRWAKPPPRPRAPRCRSWPAKVWSAAEDLREAGPSAMVAKPPEGNGSHGRVGALSAKLRACSGGALPRHLGPGGDERGRQRAPHRARERFLSTGCSLGKHGTSGRGAREGAEGLYAAQRRGVERLI